MFIYIMWADSGRTANCNTGSTRGGAGASPKISTNLEKFLSQCRSLKKRGPH